MPTPTAEDLRAAYDRAPLLRLRGISFAQAMTTSLIRLGLSVSAMGHRVNAARRGEPMPVQGSLDLRLTP